MDAQKPSNVPQPPVEPIEKAPTFSQIWEFLWSFIKDILDLERGVDKAATIEEIKNKKSLAGANAWMLMCSVMIASLGLDRNSPAVIIGAMLISPLMSPILGLGLGVGINDRSVIRKSLLHFTTAIVIALLVSTLYFLITPIGQENSEILARTEPTILDVIIAFFGGIAGIISIARKDISTTIPGVAIATALMPPLCVTGFGIATGNWDIALSSFYLFFSNTFFIVLSTYIIVRFLNFPYRKYMNKRERRRNRIYVIFFSLITMIPSFFIMKNVVQQISLDKTIKSFIVAEFGEEMTFLEDYKVIQNDTVPNKLLLKVYGSTSITEAEEEYEQHLADLGLPNWEVTVLPTSEVNLDRVANLERQIDNVEKLGDYLDSLENIKSNQEENIADLQSVLKSNMLDSTYFDSKCKMAYDNFPDLIKIAIGSIPFQNFQDSTTAFQDIVIVKWKEGISPLALAQLEKNLSFFLKGTLNKSELIIIRE